MLCAFSFFLSHIGEAERIEHVGINIVVVIRMQRRRCRNTERASRDKGAVGQGDILNSLSRERSCIAIRAVSDWIIDLEKGS